MRPQGSLGERAPAQGCPRHRTAPSVPAGDTEQRGQGVPKGTVPYTQPALSPALRPQGRQGAPGTAKEHQNGQGAPERPRGTRTAKECPLPTPPFP